jgi:flagellar L-ring protein precursor FlgH
MSFRSIAAVLSLGPLLALSTGCTPKQVQLSGPSAVDALAASAKRADQKAAAGEGSLWMGNAGRTDLFRDFKAHDLNDIVMIRVDESTAAVSNADSKNTKSTAATAGFDKLFGLEKQVKELPTLVSGKSDGSFEGKGSTTRTTTLQTTLTARVIDVLPSGYLVVEGVREIRVNNENQNVYLSGVVRPKDINRDNVVSSSAVAQMTVRVQGRGMVSQPLKPGWLYRIISGVLPF